MSQSVLVDVADCFQVLSPLSYLRVCKVLEEWDLRVTRI